MKSEKSSLSLAPDCASVAIVVMLALVPAFAFAQLSVTTECPEDECHVAPFFRGSGGFVGQFNADAMADGEALTSVGLVVTCGSITTTASAEPAADGTVAYLFNDMNGLACYQDNGEIEIHGLMDGGWYWIHDEMNSAVSNLLPKYVLDNVQTLPFDASGGDITMTKGTGGHATLVKDTASGRVGILPHIIPAPEPAKCGGADDLRSGCLLSGDYTVEIKDADGMSVDGMAVQRGDADIALTVTLGAEGAILVNPDEAAVAAFVYSGPGGSELPGVYTGSDVWMALDSNDMMGEYRSNGGSLVTSVSIAVPPATNASGALLATVEDATNDDPCRSGSQTRDVPISVVITGSSTNTIPGIGTTDRPMASFRISCPPAP